MTEYALEIEQVVDDDLLPLEKAVTVVVPAFNEAAHVAKQTTAQGDPSSASAALNL